MKVNFNRPFKDPFGNVITDKNLEPKMINKELGLELFNLGSIGNEPLTQEQKYMAYSLSMKLANSDGDIELESKEIEFIDEVAARTYKAGAYGNIKSILNGE